MIKTYYPFNLKEINSIDEYLFIIKNCFRLIKKYGVSKKSSGIFVFIRWCDKLNNWVFDFDKNNNKGIQIKNKDIYFENSCKFNALSFFNMLIDNKEFISILDKFYLKKKLNRTLGFIYNNNDTVYPLGLYTKNYINKKIEYILIEKNSIQKELINIDSRIVDLKLQINIKNYIDEYNKFIEKLRSITIKKKEKDFILKNYLSLSRASNSLKLSFKNYSDIVHNNIFPKETYLFYYVMYNITIEASKYLNDKINTEFDLIFDDKINKKTIKLPYAFYCNRQHEKKDLLPPLIPMRF